MKYPDLIGRESWEWGVSEVCNEEKDPPKNWGKKPSPRETLIGKKSGRPQDKVIVVVECYCFLYIYIYIIVELA